MSRRASITLFLVAMLFLVVAHVAEAREADPLVGSQWWVEDIQQGGVIDNSRTTLHFPEPGRVAGNSGCNRYMGGYERDGASIRFGRLAGTMKACPEALLNQERRFLDAMAEVVAWRIDPLTGLLHLLDEEGDTLVRASSMNESEAVQTRN